MTCEHVMVFLERSGWSVVSRAASSAFAAADRHEADPAAVGPAIAEEIAGLHGQARSLVLALDTNLCLCGSLVVDDLPRRDRRQAMLYRLEESLPLAAEEISAGFTPGGRKVVGVAVRAAWLEPLVRSLQEAGLTIAAISPAALMAFQHLQSSSPSIARESDVVLWRHGDTVHCFELDSGAIAAWRAFDYSAAAIRQWLALLTLERRAPLRVTTVVLDDDALSLVRDVGDVAITRAEDLPLLEAAAQMSAAVCDGAAEPICDLSQRRSGAFGIQPALRRPLQAALASVFILVITLVAVLMMRGRQYESQAATLLAQQQALFAEAFPEQAMPRSPRSRLISEARRVAGVAGAGSEAPASLPSCLMLLYEVLTRLPSDVRFRIAELRLDGSDLYLDGDTQTHSDADAIAVALRAGSRLEIAPPRTERREEAGVSFRLQGRVLQPGGTATVAPRWETDS